MGMFKKPRGAQRAAEQAEAQRMQGMRETTGAINSAYANPQREAGISQYVSAIREMLGGDLSKQQANANRQLKFALSRNGQLGSSVQVDQQEDQNNDYARGVMNLERQAQGGGDGLRDADNQARLALIDMASNGMDATTGAQRANESIRNSLASNYQRMMVDGLGDVFGAGKDFWQTSKENAGRRRARQESQLTQTPVQRVRGPI